MATDATGTPTSLGIPKFNTAADAPSGLGGNAQMDSIDTLVAARVVKPSGIVSGEVPVWNGSSWDRSSVTPINPLNISSAWTPYTPTWSSTAPAPVINNGTLAGRYVQIGKTVLFLATMTAGTLTTFGGANSWTISLPVTANANAIPFGWIRANHSGSSYAGMAHIASTSTMVLLYPSSNGAVLSFASAAPFAWASGDFFQVAGFYEAA